MNCARPRIHQCQGVVQRSKYTAVLYHERTAYSIKFSESYMKENRTADFGRWTNESGSRWFRMVQ